MEGYILFALKKAQRESTNDANVVHGMYCSVIAGTLHDIGISDVFEDISYKEAFSVFELVLEELHKGIPCNGNRYAFWNWLFDGKHKDIWEPYI